MADDIITLQDITRMMRDTEYNLPGWKAGKVEKPPIIGDFDHTKYDYLFMAPSSAVGSLETFEFLPEVLAPDFREKYGEGLAFKLGFAEPLHNLLRKMSRCFDSQKEPESPLKKKLARKLYSEVFTAFNPDHSYGNYARAYLQAIADALELGNLDKDPPQKTQPTKAR